MTGFNERGRCLCRSCGRTFSGLTAFDSHQRSLPVAPWVACTDPAEMRTKAGDPRLVLRAHRSPSGTVREVWHFPGVPDDIPVHEDGER